MEFTGGTVPFVSDFRILNNFWDFTVEEKPASITLLAVAIGLLYTVMSPLDGAKGGEAVALDAVDVGDPESVLGTGGRLVLTVGATVASIGAADFFSTDKSLRDLSATGIVTSLDEGCGITVNSCLFPESIVDLPSIATFTLVNLLRRLLILSP